MIVVMVTVMMAYGPDMRCGDIKRLTCTLHLRADVTREHVLESGSVVVLGTQMKSDWRMILERRGERKMQKYLFVPSLVSQCHPCRQQIEHPHIAFNRLRFWVGTGTSAFRNFPPECFHTLINGQTIDEAKFPYF